MEEATPDWSHELAASLRWIGLVYAATIAGFALVVWLLARYTTWGRQVRRLSWVYFRPGDGVGTDWRPVSRALGLLLLTVVAVRIQVLVSYANNGIYTALQGSDPADFLRGVGIFGVLAAVAILRALVAYYLQQAFVIRWRVWLNGHFLDDWLGGRAYHRGHYLEAQVDNPDQRIQEDVETFTSNTASFALGVVDAMLSLVSFTIILWSLSGPLTVFGVEIPRAMTFLTYLYVLVATVIAFRIGRPLIRLNFLNEGFAASYRYGLVRLRENSEGIAFHRGEVAERSALTSRFGALIANTWQIVYRGLRFQGWNASITQLSVVFPLVVQAPRLFSGALKLGDVVQTGSAFGQVHDSLSYFRNAYDDFADYRAAIDRLTGLLDADAAARALPELPHEPGPGLDITGLTVRRPDGTPLVEDLHIRVAPGEALLVGGASGSGKTTLLRSLAGLWPYAEGRVARDQDAMFLSQRPYLPLGSLRAALAYPEPAESVTDEQAEAVLGEVHLGHLAGRLDEWPATWSRTLSPGEQQRLAFGRVLRTRPGIVFLDEATAALDEGIEYELYTLLRRRCPEMVVVSVGHRSTLAPLHTDRLELLGDGRWAIGARR